MSTAIALAVHAARAIAAVDMSRCSARARACVWRHKRAPAMMTTTPRAAVRVCASTAPTTNASAANRRARPVLFLDIDGVLNRTATAKQIIVEDDKVQRLHDIITTSDADIVLSSYWRSFERYIGYTFERHGLRKGCVVGRTAGEPHLTDSVAHDDKVHLSRVLEIEDYLKRVYGDDDGVWPKFAIVDDKAVVPDGHAWSGAFVRTVHDVGLTEAHSERLKAILSTV